MLEPNSVIDAGIVHECVNTAKSFSHFCNCCATRGEVRQIDNDCFASSSIVSQLLLNCGYRSFITINDDWNGSFARARFHDSGSNALRPSAYRDHLVSQL